MMNRRERLMATLRGQPVDHPAVSFYEINGFDEDTTPKDPYNIYSHPSWLPLIELAREKTDRTLMRGVPFVNTLPDPVEELTTTQTTIDENGSRYIHREIKAGSRILTSTTRQDPDINTIWQIEHPLKDSDDLKAYLKIPAPEIAGKPDISGILKTETALGDTGIVMIDIADPLCYAADLFSMADYTVIALTEPVLFHKLLERFFNIINPRTDAIAQALPGRLWRICGSEYASPPYLPPRLFREYMTRYDTPIVQSIKKYGGFPRIHSHGRLKAILDDIVSTGCTALDPIEPLPQGDIELKFVREKYGDQLALFGNLEASDIENLPVNEFEKKIHKAIDEGTSGKGRGFVLMASASPYGRVLSSRSLKNYERMVEIIEKS